MEPELLNASMEPRRDHRGEIHTAGVEKKAFLTEDQSLHRRVLDALNRAIVG